MVGPDNSVYAGIGNPYLSQYAAQKTPSRQLYTDSIVKLIQATGKLEWYYQAFPDDFHDWDMQISPIYTMAAGHPVVLDATKGGFVFAFNPASGALLWKTAVGMHNGHDTDGQLALAGKLKLMVPYTLLPGDFGGVETNMAAAGGVVYVPVVNLAETMTNAKSVFGSVNYAKGSGEMVAIDLATGKNKQSFTFTASATGTYAIVCGVPGHAVAGMWDVLQVTKGGTATIKTTNPQA
jgi:glucose dehydrogenase